jgi:quercetin dioxygenase-like cupin family protein
MVVATVRFAPGARTAWHSHEHGQYLRVTQGVGRFGGRDGTIIEVHLGQTLYTPPGEEHWHAAAPGCFMEHIAMLQNGEDQAKTTTWGEHITDDEYNGSSAGPEPRRQERTNFWTGSPQTTIRATGPTTFQ